MKRLTLKLKTVTVKVALTINIATLVVPGHFFKRINLKLIFIFVLVGIDITLFVLLLLTLHFGSLFPLNSLLGIA